MPKKKRSETPEEQSDRFRAEVQRMIADGELNPIEADARFEAALKGAAPQREGVKKSSRPRSTN